MRRDAPVLTVIVFVREVLLVVCEVAVELKTLFEVLGGFETADVFEEVEVAVGVDASANQAVPVDALKLDVRVVDLEGKV